MPDDQWKVRVIATNHVPEVLTLKFPVFQPDTDDEPVCFMEQASYMTNEYGWLLYARNRHVESSLYTTPPEGVDKEHWTMALQALDRVLVHFHKLDFTFVMFDADGDADSDLPTFNW
jgi:hypothetical protein